ncbi:hypothetical protein [Streptomyces piniterrae]|uniref:hypothetical protein n=1 Tax=Streptomyces piniterrae TaxID=2571125 RepID=UPI001C9E55F8
MSDQRGEPSPLAGKWAAFRRSPFLPATVLMFILAAAAGLFAGSYTYAMANPAPRHIPTAVVGPGHAPQQKTFVAGMERALNASLKLTEYATYGEARRAVDDQREFAILRAGGEGVELDVSGASGASVALLLAEAGAKVGATAGLDVRIRDVKPLQHGDPRGLALFRRILSRMPRSSALTG